MIGLEGKQLRSQRLTYRLLCGADKNALASLLSDRSVTEPAGFLPANTDAEFDTFFDRLTRYNAAVAALLDGKLIGYLHVNPYHDDGELFRDRQCVGVGFVIGGAYQNHGYGTEMLTYLTQYLLSKFDACFADHFVENIPSRRVIERSGYTYYEDYRMYFDELACEKTCASYYRVK